MNGAAPEEVSRLAKKLSDAKAQDEVLKSSIESPSTSSNAIRKKLAQAITNDASTDENVSNLVTLLAI